MMTEVETVGTAMRMKGVKLSMEELHLAYLFDKLRYNFG